MDHKSLSKLLREIVHANPNTEHVRYSKNALSSHLHGNHMSDRVIRNLNDYLESHGDIFRIEDVDYANIKIVIYGNIIS